MVQDDILVRLAGLCYRYREGGRDHAVLAGLDGTIHRGEYLALLGPSGSGKSTLLNLIAGLDLPEAGDVIIDGSAVNRLDERRRTLFRRRHIGFVFQFFNLLPTLTVAENVLLPLELSGMGAARRGQALELLEEVGLSERAGSYPDQLSGGEQQRVAVVRALAHAPKLVLADEPTGNLDGASGARILALFDRFMRGQGMTLLVVTHDREVAGRADRIVQLRGGRLAEAGP
jgi:putative ABC transport system ATP-binding protein